MEIRVVNLNNEQSNLEELLSSLKKVLKETDEKYKSTLEGEIIDSMFFQAEKRFGKNWKVREIETNFGKVATNKNIFFDVEEDVLINKNNDILYLKGKWAVEITYKPFDKVAVFDEKTNTWFADFVSHYDPETGKFNTVGYENIPFENISKDLKLIGKSK